jgi:AAA family ATP:ADP antiporter
MPLSFGEKLLSAGADIKAGEGKNIYLLMSALFFLLITAYLLKPVREMLILTQGGSEVRSYAVALQAGLLILLLPIYGICVRKFESRKFMIGIALFFSTNLFFFYLWGITGHTSSIPFFIWLGAFGILMVSQFWAFASQIYGKQAGERLFALVAVGAGLGSWVGAASSRFLVTHFSANEIILISIVTLLISIAFAANVKGNDAAHVIDNDIENPDPVSYWSGFALVAKSQYLFLIAIFVILMNWGNSTGEYLLSVVVEGFYDHGIAAGTMGDSKATYIGKFYSEFYLWVNLVAVIFQFFIVSRLIKKVGFNWAFIITPILVMLGYGVLAFFPIVAFFKVIKIAENGLDYSLQNTTRQILFLPTSRREKYEARAVIDTVCWRIGDLLQAASIFIGLHLLNILPRHFVWLNVVLAACMIILGVFIGKIYQSKKNNSVINDHNT